MLDTLHSLGALALMALAAYGVGEPLVRVLRLNEEDPLSRTVWSLALGLLAAGLLLTALGLLGVLYRPLIILLTSCGAGCGLFSVGVSLRASMAKGADSRPHPVQVTGPEPAQPDAGPAPWVRVWTGRRFRRGRRSRAVGRAGSAYGRRCTVLSPGIAQDVLSPARAGRCALQRQRHVPASDRGLVPVGIGTRRRRRGAACPLDVRAAAGLRDGVAGDPTAWPAMGLAAQARSCSWCRASATR